MKALQYLSLCLLVLTFLSKNNIVAQTRTTPEIDSLNLVLEGELPFQDRIKTMYELGNQYLLIGGFSQERISLFQSLIELTRSQGQFSDSFARSLITLGRAYQGASKLDKADSLAKYVLDVKDEGFSDSTRLELEINFFYIRGVVNLLKGIPDTAIVYLEKTEALAIEMQRKRRITSTQGALAITYEIQGNYSKSIEAYQRILSNLDPEDKMSRLRNYYNLAVLYGRVEDFRNSLKFNAKAKEIAISLVDLKDYFFIAPLDLTVHLDIGELDSVKIKLEAYKNALAANDYNLELSTLSNLYFIESILAYKLHDTTTFVSKTEAWRDLIPEDQATEMIQIRVHLMHYYAVMADYHQMFGRFDQALELIHKAKLLEEENKRTDMIVVDIYPRLIKLYELKGDFENAYSYQKEFMVVKDSLFNEKKALDIGRAESQLQLSEQENDILLAEAQITNQRSLITLAIVGIVALVIILVISYRAYLSKKAANTALDKKNEELGLALASLEMAQGQLIASEKLASMGRLYAGLAHEINNPLVFVKSGVDTLERKLEPLNHKLAKDEDKLDWVLDIIKDGIKRVQVIVNSISHHSSETTGAVSSENVNETIDSILTLMQSEIKDTVKINKNYNEIPEVAFSKGQLGQVFMNILMNAVQAMDGKGEIDIETSKTENELIISFKDTGIGMDEEIKEKVFEPFFTTKPPGVGLGLGLHISRSAVEANNGKITVESEGIGMGSTFVVKFKLTA